MKSVIIAVLVIWALCGVGGSFHSADANATGVNWFGLIFLVGSPFLPFILNLY